ncbi:hypothetical protein Patl1_24982 [Pistacia atlantica]|uniref:Uncharacterized protein n=1 Tax=Pistacia atlantica TaxID=434234 RepID=A0ACC1B3L5_9ROSI|nr:hypothetical protein Patl1_24982 [Pistacia atlantica]
MAAGTMVTAAGAAVLLYYVLSRRIAAKDAEEGNRGEDLSKSNRSMRRRIVRRPAQAPATWTETITTLSETLRFTYSETLGKWPIADLAFGINYLMRKQGNLEVASVYAGSDSKPFPVFLESAGYSQEDVLVHKPKAAESYCHCFHSIPILNLLFAITKHSNRTELGSRFYIGGHKFIWQYVLPSFLEVKVQPFIFILPATINNLLKPAFTIIRDQNSKCFLLLIRGTHSIKDTLTAATGAVVPFHHSVLQDGGISNLVLGYAHCGMVAAARWIAKLSTPCLLKALGEHPDYKVKIVGHSLGGGTAALLTYILREQKELSSCTCFAFASAACMTWDLAESGKHFITTLINGSDLVPTFSAASVDDLRSEVTASSWLNDLRDQVERTRVLNVVYRSATALGSRLPSIASAKARVVGAGALLRPVSNSTQVVMNRAKNVAEAVVRTRSSLSSWSCMGPRRRAVGPLSNSNVEDTHEAPLIAERSSEALVRTVVTSNVVQNGVEYTSSGGSGHDDSDEEEQLITVDGVITTSTVEGITEGELWYELEKELKRKENEIDVKAQEEEAAAAKEITEEENVLADSAETRNSISSSDIIENHHFYPPGRIMHIVSIPSSSFTANLDGDVPMDMEEHVGIYETPRNLYSKIRLSRTMINDHYMPMYKKMMELLTRELENDVTSNCGIVQA